MQSKRHASIYARASVRRPRDIIVLAPLILDHLACNDFSASQLPNRKDLHYYIMNNVSRLLTSLLRLGAVAVDVALVLQRRCVNPVILQQHAVRL